MPKFLNDQEAILDSDLYYSVFEKRGIKFITIRRTKDFKPLTTVDVEVKNDHTWSYGDSLGKLSLKYYGTLEYWWVIGVLNGKPTDSHCSIGDVLSIPRSPVVVAEALRE